MLSAIGHISNIRMLFSIGHIEPDWRLGAYLVLTWIRHLSLWQIPSACNAALPLANMHSNFYVTFHIWENLQNFKNYTCSMCWTTPTMLCYPFQLVVKPDKISHHDMQRVKRKNKPTMKMENYQHSEDMIKENFREISLSKVTAFCSVHIYCSVQAVLS